MSTLSRADLDGLLGIVLTDEQWGCVSAPMRPEVIVAGAGTGKTTVMAARVLWLVASGLAREHEVLGLTFTNKAAAQLAHKVTVLLRAWRQDHPLPADEAGEPTIATYHSFARRLLDEQGLRLGIEPGARLLSGAAVAQLAHRVVCGATDLVATRHGPSRVAADVIALDANLAEQTITTDELRAHDRGVVAEIDGLAKRTRAIADIRETALRRIELAGLVDALRAERERVGGLDFSDHMRLCVDLVRSSAELVESMRSAYRVVLLDEYQDTSIAQRVILSTLFAGTAVTAVGDPLQAIYGWRSASVANIAAFGSHFAGGPDSRVLSMNRRSGDAILSAANEVAAELRAQHPEVAALRAPEPRRAQVRAALLTTIEEERAWIADQIAEVVLSGRPADEVAVLARTNESLVPIRDALVARGIPASVTGTAELVASPFAAAVLATLRLLVDAGDNTAAVALLSAPRWRIGPADLEALAHRASSLVDDADPGRMGGRGRAADRRSAGRAAREADDRDLGPRLADAVATTDPVLRPSLLEAASDPGPGVSAQAKARLSEFVAEIRHLQAHVGEPLADLTARVVHLAGAQVEADLAALRVAGSLPVGAAPEEDVGLDGLLQLVDGFSDADGRSSLGAFLAYLDAAEQLGSDEEVDLPAQPGAVRLMTTHQAKGLEFPVVVLPHLCLGVFPGKVGSDRWTTQAHVVPSELRDDRHVLPALRGFTSAEHAAFLTACRAHDRSGDDRLAYVAITRAEDLLVASGHWWGPTQKGLRGPSPYLELLRGEALAAAGTLFAREDPWAEQPCGEQGSAPSNPLLELVDEAPWPQPDPAEDDPVVRAARAIEELVQSGPIPTWGPAADLGQATRDRAGHLASACHDPDPRDRVADQVAQWDRAIEALLARSDESAEPATVRLPEVLTASTTLELAGDANGLARRLLRPMPRRRSRSADLGTAFHAWVESRLGVQPLITDDELPGAADEGIQTAEELAVLKESFERLPYAARQPVGLEVPFSIELGGRIVRGRIDAVFPAAPDAPAGQLWEVVDWKTSARDDADPLQLAIYRAAWAEVAGVPIETVGAAFAFVRTARIVRPANLLERAELAELLVGEEVDAIRVPGSRPSARSGR